MRTLILISLLLIHSFADFAQISKTVSGTVTHNEGFKLINYQLPAGNIKIITTDDQGNYNDGSLLSGTIYLEPGGNKSRMEKNLKELQEHFISIDNNRIELNAAQQSFTYPFTAGKKTCNIQLNHKDGSFNAMEWMTAEPRPMGINPHIPGKGIICPQKIFFKDSYVPAFSTSDALRFGKGDRFFAGDTRNKMKELPAVCSSPSTVIFKLPADLDPGPVSIYMYHNDKLTDRVIFYYYDLQFTSPNTNLRSGQLSTVTAKIETGIGDIVRYPLSLPFALDVKNLSSSVIALQGGNFQHFEYPKNEDISNAAAWSVTRTITGIVPGSFNITATLYPDNVVTENPFTPELAVLEIPDEFNNWIDKVISDISALNDAQHFSPAVAKWVMNNLNHCSSQDKLDEYKAYSGMVLRNMNIPKGAAVLWPSSLEAAKTACSHLKTGRPVDVAILRNGLSFCDHLFTKLNKKDLLPQVSSARQALTDLLQNSSPENILNCRSKTQELFSNTSSILAINPASLYNYRELLSATYELLPPKIPGGVHPFNDLIGYVDKLEKKFYVDPGYRDAALSSLNAVAMNDGKYRINIKAGEKEMIDTITIGDKLPKDEFIDHEEDGLNIPGAKVDMPMDTIAQFSYGKDNYKIYSNAECRIVSFLNPGPCEQEKNGFLWTTFTKYEQSGCSKGKSICVEIEVTYAIRNIYSDNKCKVLVSSTPITTRGCKQN